MYEALDHYGINISSANPLKTRAIAEARIKYDKFDTVIEVRRYSQMNEKATAVMCNDRLFTVVLLEHPSNTLQALYEATIQRLVTSRRFCNNFLNVNK